MMIFEKRISLIYPQATTNNDRLFIDDDDYKILIGGLLYTRDIDICEFMSDDEETIKYRQEIFRDMLEEPKITELFQEILPMLENINELYRLRDNSFETEGHIYSIKLIEIYVSFINTTNNKFQQLKNHYNSKSLLNFSETIGDIADDIAFKNLMANTAKLSKEISRVKSITVGLNLDHTFTPYEFGVLSLNDKHVISNSFMDRLTRKNDNNTLSALCPLKITSKTFSDDEKHFADMAINSVMNKLLKSSIKDWEPAIKSFFKQNTKMFLPLIKELKFLLFGARITQELSSRKLPLTMPKIKPKSEKAFCVKGIYNPIIGQQRDKMIYNDIDFDENGRIYIITGPNSGGKSVFTSAIGICQIFAQLGFLVPAKFAEISPVDYIFVSFANKSASKSKGRFEEECVRIKNIFKKLTEYSLVLMDETFSGTSAFEGKHIACDVISGISAFGCRAVYSTHIHELVPMIEQINSNPNSKSTVDTLTVGIDDNGNRTYKITRTLPDGKSYAKSISQKYGLSYEDIMKQLNQQTIG